ncbi:MAG: hypothetical protein KDA45_08210 [Planctomycetales bacterium]|nr:hypothetical protein [Planctomycetales bacterium]
MSFRTRKRGLAALKMNLLGMLLLCALATQVWGAEPLPNIILCMGDDHGWDETGYKGQLYEGGLRVPGIIEWPARMAESRTSDVHAVTSDILPTLHSLSGGDYASASDAP